VVPPQIPWILLGRERLLRFGSQRAGIDYLLCGIEVGRG
jgi:hypothetical protein